MLLSFVSPWSHQGQKGKRIMAGQRDALPIAYSNIKRAGILHRTRPCKLFA